MVEGLIFEWDERKNNYNRRKHGVSFEEVEEVFADPQGLQFDDPVHSADEQRSILIGMTLTNPQLITVVFTERHYLAGKRATITLRIINARPATSRERRHYEQGY